MSEAQDMHVKMRPDIYKNDDDILPLDIFLLLIEHELIYVYKEDSKVLGLMLLYYKHIENVSHKTRNFVFIDAISLKKEYRGIGIGALLINKAKSIKEEKHFDSIELEVNALNKDAYNMYLKCGFKEQTINIKLL